MNLKEWSEKSGILPTYPTTEREAVSVVVDHQNPHRKLLWDLTDYVVTSDCGVVIWLRPIPTPTSGSRRQ